MILKLLRSWLMGVGLLNAVKVDLHPAEPAGRFASPDALRT